MQTHELRKTELRPIERYPDGLQPETVNLIHEANRRVADVHRLDAEAAAAHDALVSTSGEPLSLKEATALGRAYRGKAYAALEREYDARRLVETRLRPAADAERRAYIEAEIRARNDRTAELDAELARLGWSNPFQRQEIVQQHSEITSRLLTGFGGLEDWPRSPWTPSKLEAVRRELSEAASQL